MSAMQLWFSNFALLLAPIAAVIAGGVTWFLARDERPGDKEMAVNFMVSFVVVCALSAGLFLTDSVRRIVDPEFAVLEHVSAMPVAIAMQEHRSSEWSAILGKIAPIIEQQPSVAAVEPVIFAQYVPLARQLLPFANESVALDYAHATLAALKELEDRDPAVCIAVAWTQAARQPPEIKTRISPAAFSQFESAVVGLIVNKRSTGPQIAPAATGENSFAAMQRSYAKIRASIEARYSDGYLRRLQSPDVLGMEPKQACAATIELLERSLAEPAVGRKITTNLLRS